MNIKFVSNDYHFKNDTDLMVAKMVNSGSTHIIEFYLNNEKMYYYVISEKEIEELDDLAIINKAVEKMREDEARWILDCSLYLDNLESFILHERATVYRAQINELTKQCVNIMIVEENNSRFVLNLRDETSGATVITHLRADSREELIEMMDGIARLIIQVLKPFREKQELLVLNSFGADFALRQGQTIVDSLEERNKKQKEKGNII